MSAPRGSDLLSAAARLHPGAAPLFCGSHLRPQDYQDSARHDELEDFFFFDPGASEVDFKQAAAAVPARVAGQIRVAGAQAGAAAAALEDCEDQRFLQKDSCQGCSGRSRRDYYLEDLPSEEALISALPSLLISAKVN